MKPSRKHKIFSFFPTKLSFCQRRLKFPTFQGLEKSVLEFPNFCRIPDPVATLHLAGHILPYQTYLTWPDISHLAGHISPGQTHLTWLDISHLARHISLRWTYLTWPDISHLDISPGQTFLTWLDISHLDGHISPGWTYLT